MVTTQLYHALHNEKLLPEEVVWEDLDEFLKRQGNSAIPPRTVRATLGTTVSASACHPATRRLPRDRARPMPTRQTAATSSSTDGCL
jgi:hypothetical protein